MAKLEEPVISSIDATVDHQELSCIAGGSGPRGGIGTKVLENWQYLLQTESRMLLHNNVNVFNTTELYLKKWLG